MTKDVLVSISGLHNSVYDDDVDSAESEEPIEIITPATYYYKNGKHYVIFEEMVEGFSEGIRNKIRITENEKLEIMKSGITNTSLIFEKDRINMTPYKTPYGEILVGTHTYHMDTQVQEEEIHVQAEYALDINGEKSADCQIQIKIKAAACTP